MIIGSSGFPLSTHQTGSKNKSENLLNGSMDLERTREAHEFAARIEFLEGPTKERGRSEQPETCVSCKDLCFHNCPVNSGAWKRVLNRWRISFRCKKQRVVFRQMGKSLPDVLDVT